MRIDTATALVVMSATLLLAVAQCCQFFSAWRATVRSKNASELLAAVSWDKTCAGRYFVVAVVLLSLFAGTKAFLLLKGLFTSTPATLTAFGAAEGGGLVGHLGLCGLMIGASGVLAGFRYLRATHYLQVFFALRKELGLEGHF
jgi:hypothetical protein